MARGLISKVVLVTFIRSPPLQSNNPAWIKRRVSAMEHYYINIILLVSIGELWTMKTYFFCYDAGLSRKLRAKGIRHITVAVHPNTCRMFWLYEQTPELSAALGPIR